jgi:hypothetical protein
MTRRVGVDLFAVEPGRAEGQHARRGGRHILDHDVEVKLLRNLRVRPVENHMVQPSDHGSDSARYQGGWQQAR